jgi:hypothetical protein
LNACGGDATKQFLNFHKENLLEKYSKFIIGKVKGEISTPVANLKENIFGEGRIILKYRNFLC